MKELIELTGTVFGRLLVLKEVERHPKDNSRQWLTLCSCGKETIVQQRSLRDGSKKSCGCLWNELNSLDLVNKTFGFLTVLEKSRQEDNDNGVTWICKCHCGNIVTVSTSYLKTGHTRSCGCLQRSIVGNLNRSHGMSGTSTYTSWKSMLTRCYNQNILEYKNYGGRGIKVCDRWRYSFENFFTDMGAKPSSAHTLERDNVNKDYSPENCRWATREIQSRNTRLQLNPMNGITAKPNGKYLVRLSVKNNRLCLGTYDTIEEAQQARKEGENQYWIK